jgi:hypothetical protein
VIAELTPDPKTLATAEMHVNRTRGENIKTDKLWREKLLQHISVRPLPRQPDRISSCSNLISKATDASSGLFKSGVAVALLFGDAEGRDRRGSLSDLNDGVSLCPAPSHEYRITPSSTLPKRNETMSSA